MVSHSSFCKGAPHVKLSLEHTDQMYHKILYNELVFGEDISPLARDILSKLLNRDPNQRLGNNGAEEIKRHPFFSKNIDFHKLLQKKIQPPFKPTVSSPVVSIRRVFYEKSFLINAI